MCAAAPGGEAARGIFAVHRPGGSGLFQDRAVQVRSRPATFFRLPLSVASDVDQRGRLLAELASSVAPRGYRVAYDLLNDRAEAEEAVQEALARACEHIDSLREPGAAHGWFLRIVTNHCLRTLRRRRLKRALLGRLFGDREGSGTDDEGNDADLDGGLGSEAVASPAVPLGGAAATPVREPGQNDVTHLPAAAARSSGHSDRSEKAISAEGLQPSPMAPSPRDALVHAQELRAMLRSLEGLAPKQRAAVVLRYGHDLSVAEIADILGVEPATAKTHLVRGLGRLRELMEDHL
jgi:RNA polymerase sigma factor (sigma-70 family)